MQPHNAVSVPAAEQRHSLRPHPSSVSLARQIVRSALYAGGREDLVDSAELAVSEVVTNALVHAGTPVDLSVAVGVNGVHIAVSDGSPHLPTRRDHTELASTGRGLRLLEQLVDGWGVQHRPPGKTVWFALSSGEGDEPTITDLDALLDAFPDPAPTDAADHLEVTLLEFPLLLHSAWQMQAESVLREYLLSRIDADSAQVDGSGDAVEAHAAAQDAMALLREHVPVPDVGEHPEELMAAAVEPLVSADHLLLPIPTSSVAHFAVLDSMLDEASELADSGAFLTPPTQSEVRSFRRWVCRQVREQSDGEAPAAWGGEADAVRTIRPLLEWDPAPVAATTEAVIAAADTNRIVAVSGSAVELLGYGGTHELVGRRLVDIIPTRYRQAHLAGFTLHLFAGRSPLLGQQVTVPALRADGSEIVIELLVDAERLPNGRRVFVARMRLPVPADA